MTNNTLAGFKSIDSFVDHKLSLLEKTDKTMKSLFELMFSESNNIFCESTDGYKIKKTTYLESKENISIKANAISNILSSEEKGKIVGLYLENSLDWLELFWAILKAGFIPLLINTRIDDITLEEVFKKHDVKAVISKDKNFNIKNIYVDEINNMKLCDEVEDKYFQNEVLLMSSNTSSHLKICSYTGMQFYYQIKDSGYIIKESSSIKKHYEGELKLLTFLPFYHIFGLVAVYIWFCFFSRTLVLLKDFNPKTILNTVRKHQVTHIFAVPLFWEKIYKSAIEKIKERGEKTYNKFLKGLKIANNMNEGLFRKIFVKKAFKEVRENIFGDSISFLINGGGYISNEAISFMNGIGYHLANGYGMTEIGITSVELSESAKERNKASVGKPFKSLQYKINENNELLVKGISIANKIYSDGNVITNEDTWFNTHDIFNEINGKYYINGRVDDLIICNNGENINPNIIEPKLYVNGVNKLCIINDNNTIVLLVEVSKYVDACHFNEIVTNINLQISEKNLNSMINKVVFTTSPLLLSNDFKLNRKKVKERYINNEFRIIDNNTLNNNDNESDELIVRIKEIFSQAIGKCLDEITLDGHFFFELGGSSLDYFTMITNIQNEFGISFPSNMQGSISTVREMADYIRKNI